MNCITYSSCQGHAGTPEGSAARERRVGIVSRDQAGHDSVLAILRRAAASANALSDSHDVRVMPDAVIVSEGGIGHPGVDLRFERLRDEAAYFHDLETAYRRFVHELERAASDGRPGNRLGEMAADPGLMPEISFDSQESIDTDVLAKFARKGRFPLRSPCPNGCLFCYERNMSRMIPKSYLARMPVLTPQAFDSLLEQAAAVNLPLDPGSSRTTLPDGSVMFFSFSDFFSQGLSESQIDRLLSHNEQRPPVPYLYTNAQTLEPQMAKRLSERHPTSFLLYVSVFTFNDGIKTRLVPKWPGSRNLLQILPDLRKAIVYLTHFSFEQTIADLQTVSTYAHPSNPPIVLLSRLHHNRLHPPVIRQLAEGGLAEVPRLVEHLATHRDDLPNIDKVLLQFPSTAYVWLFREFLAGKLAALDLGEGDVVLGSRAAYPVLRRLLAATRAEVHGVADPLGGSTDFATTVTTPNLIARVQARKNGGIRVKRIVVPSSMWPWEGRCLAGGTVDDISRRFPGVDVSVVDIPLDYISSSLTIDNVRAFFQAGGTGMLAEV
jgi:hypothetical protein